LPFDRLVLATGSQPYLPPLAGSRLPGVATLRTAEDAIRIRSYAQACPGRRAVVAGAGLLGLEIAYALHQLGFTVTVLERGARLLPRIIDDGASEHLAEYLAAVGIAVRPGAEAAGCSGAERVEQVDLRDGSTLPADLLVACAGVRPDLRLAVEAGLAVGVGIRVDASMRTSHPDVFAAGDAAEHAGAVPGLWPIAVAQAKVAGENAVGGSARYVPKPPVALLKGVGISLVSCGLLEPEGGDQVETFEGPGTHAYLRIVLRDGIVIGALSVARPEDVAALPKGIGLTRTELLSGLRIPAEGVTPQRAE
jgi:NAD(P)H-nitrite reductase large subunit